jgi:hypothetical protein
VGCTARCPKQRDWSASCAIRTTRDGALISLASTRICLTTRPPTTRWRARTWGSPAMRAMPRAKNFARAPSACSSCHGKDDVHKGALGNDCAACHSEKTWRDTVAFDHSKTAYALEGAHKTVACEACHSGERYKGTPKTCFGCHEINDVHKGNYEAKCETCHGIETWTSIRFDHAKDAKWPLRAAHAPLKCTACHKGDVYKDKVGTTCVACHKSADVHNNALGPRCESCHNENNWHKKVDFDHSKTKLPLTGLHAGVTCEACHTSQTFKDAPTACQACHEDKAHKGSLGAQCAQCHSDTGWKTWKFDHDHNTRYPLTGAHASVQCVACHSPDAAVAPDKVPGDCYSCHKEKDMHFGVLGKSCANCHSTTKWNVL